MSQRSPPHHFVRVLRCISSAGAFCLPVFSPTLTPFSIPVKIQDGGCVSMATGFATGLWEVRECASSKAKFICRQNQGASVGPQPSAAPAPPAPPAPQPTPSLNGSCPNDWKSNDNLRYCYKVHLNAISTHASGSILHRAELLRHHPSI